MKPSKLPVLLSTLLSTLTTFGFAELDDSDVDDPIDDQFIGEGGKSPDRLDALVWAVTELMLGRRVVEPRCRVV